MGVFALEADGSWRTTFARLALDVFGCDDPLAKRKAYKLDDSGDMGHDLAT
jgi:hypothetical protein